MDAMSVLAVESDSHFGCEAYHMAKVVEAISHFIRVIGGDLS